jgi:hypothetical protein
MRRPLVSDVPRHREERDEDNENNPDVEAHIKYWPAAASPRNEQSYRPFRFKRVSLSEGGRAWATNTARALHSIMAATHARISPSTIGKRRSVSCSRFRAK